MSVAAWTIDCISIIFPGACRATGIRTNYTSATEYDYRASTSGMVWRF